MLLGHLTLGIYYLLNNIPISFAVFCAVTCIKWFVKKKFEVKLMIMLCEFAWILNVYTILQITGIIGMRFQIDAVINGRMHYSITLFEEGLSMMMLLNGLLFMPFGFFTAIIFKTNNQKRIRGFLIGLLFSVVIEFLQLFTGRYAQIDDIFMNSIGSFLGYEMWSLLSELKIKCKPHKSIIPE